MCLQILFEEKNSWELGTRAGQLDLAQRVDSELSAGQSTNLVNEATEAQISIDSWKGLLPFI